MPVEIVPETGTGYYAVWSYPLLPSGEFGPPVLLSEGPGLDAARRDASRNLLSESGAPRNVVEVRAPDGRVKGRYWHATEPERVWSRSRRCFVVELRLRPRAFRGSLSRGTGET
jgi:hypothetical protein